MEEKMFVETTYKQVVVEARKWGEDKEAFDAFLSEYYSNSNFLMDRIEKDERSLLHEFNDRYVGHYNDMEEAAIDILRTQPIGLDYSDMEIECMNMWKFAEELFGSAWSSYTYVNGFVFSDDE